MSKAGKIGRTLILPGFDKLNLTAVPQLNDIDIWVFVAKTQLNSKSVPTILVYISIKYCEE